jgi:hypothetical protein
MLAHLCSKVVAMLGRSAHIHSICSCTLPVLLLLLQTALTLNTLGRSLRYYCCYCCCNCCCCYCCCCYCCCCCCCCNVSVCGHAQHHIGFKPYQIGLESSGLSYQNEMPIRKYVVISRLPNSQFEDPAVAAVATMITHSTYSTTCSM